MPLSQGRSVSDAFPTYLSPATFSSRNRDAVSQPDQSEERCPTLRNHKTKLLGGHVSYIRCASCSADICMSSQIISKGFTGRHGRAYLVSASSSAENAIPASSSTSTASLPNTMAHKAMPRQLVTGAHTVSDLSCISCGTVVGWKYIAAEDESQKYKVGKFILETKRISTSSCWESQAGTDSIANDTHKHGDVEFDSQNEDECEDLFSGMWCPALAVRRRRRGALESENAVTHKGSIPK